MRGSFIERLNGRLTRELENAVYRSYSIIDRLVPFKFIPERYPFGFLQDEVPEYRPREAPAVIYCFWTGDNPLTPNRAAALEKIRSANAGVEVALVTKNNLNQYLIPGCPLHPAYPYLSYVHRSDYLRCYFMTLIGGGYSDIKAPTNAWQEFFDRVNDDPQVWAIGYPEKLTRDVSPVGGRLERDLKRNYRRLLGNGAYIFRPGTPFALAWLKEVNRRLDAHLPRLRRNPGGIWGDVPGYPIPWTGILGDVFHPLCLKYQDRLLKDDRLVPVLVNYR